MENKFHYHIPTSVNEPWLSQTIPFQISPSYLTKIYFNIILPYTSISKNSHLTNSRFTIILPAYLTLGLPSNVFPSGSSTNILYTFACPPYINHFKYIIKIYLARNKNPYVVRVSVAYLLRRFTNRFEIYPT